MSALEIRVADSTAVGRKQSLSIYDQGRPRLLVSFGGRRG